MCLLLLDSSIVFFYIFFTFVLCYSSKSCFFLDSQTSLITECRSAVFSGIESHCENDSWTSCNDYARVLDALARLQWFNESVISHLCNGILRLSGDTGIGLGKSVTNTNAISSTSTRNNTAAALTGGASWDDLGKLVTGFARMRVHHGDVLDSIHAALVGRLDGYRQDRQDRYAETHTNSSKHLSFLL